MARNPGQREQAAAAFVPQFGVIPLELSPPDSCGNGREERKGGERHRRRGAREKESTVSYGNNMYARGRTSCAMYAVHGGVEEGGREGRKES